MSRGRTSIVVGHPFTIAEPIRRDLARPGIRLDEIVPIAGAREMVRGWCAAGSTVQLYEGQTGEHIVFESTMAPVVYAYIAARFAGTTVLPPGTTTCN